MHEVVTWNEPHEIHIDDEGYAFAYDWYDCYYKNTEYYKAHPECSWYNIAEVFIEECSDYHANEVPSDQIKKIAKILQKHYKNA